MITHRLATQNDLSEIVAIYNSTVASRQVTADTSEVTVESRQQWFDDHSPDKRPLWVLESDSNRNILGWLSYSNFYSRPAYGATVELSIYLHPDARGQGLGSYCLQLAESHAPTVGVNTLIGLVFGHNVPSLRLFKKFGYQQWGMLPKVANLDGVECDVVIFGKRVRV